jgi:hypothetical protein
MNFWDRHTNKLTFFFEEQLMSTKTGTAAIMMKCSAVEVKYAVVGIGSMIGMERGC